MQNDENKSSHNSLYMIFGDDELGRFPDADKALAILIPALQECYKLWNPIKNNTNFKEFEMYFMLSAPSAASVYNQMQQGYTVDFTNFTQMNVPYVKEVVMILANAFKDCRQVWSETDLEYIPFVNRVMTLMCLVIFKMYENRWQF